MKDLDPVEAAKDWKAPLCEWSCSECPRLDEKCEYNNEAVGLVRLGMVRALEWAMRQVEHDPLVALVFEEKINELGGWS